LGSLDIQHESKRMVFEGLFEIVNCSFSIFEPGNLNNSLSESFGRCIAATKSI